MRCLHKNLRWNTVLPVKPIATVFLLALVILISFTGQVSAQDVKARMSLGFKNTNNEQPALEASVKYKEEGIYLPGKNVPINFLWLNPEGEEIALGTALTNDRGTATFLLEDPQSAPAGKFSGATYLARIENHAVFRDNEEELLVYPAEMTMSMEEEDSSRVLRIYVGAFDSLGNALPLEDVSVGVFVKRLFGELTITEGFEVTDEEGYLNLEFPGDIPGDAEGNLDVIARVDQYEEYGILIAQKNLTWGLPTVRDDSNLKGQLWSSRMNAPLYLVGLTTSLLITVWGVIIFMVITLFRIRKLGTQAES